MNMKSLTWPAVALVAILGGLTLGLLTLTDMTSGAVIGVIGVLAGVGGGAAVVSAGSGPAARTAEHVEEIRAETQSQTATLATVARRVNGELDQRIEAAMTTAIERGRDQAVADVVEALRREGVIGRG